MTRIHHLGWFGIVRLGLVQTALGAIVVLTTSTLNRVMVVEYALPAILPGALVALHYAVQLSRPAMGHGSDVGGRRTPWIIGGMACLALGGVLAALATALMESQTLYGILLAVIAFIMIGAGVGASGTTLLALLAKRVDPKRRAAAATIVWVMMIVGFVITAGTAGHFLDPYSSTRLVVVTSTVAVSAFFLTLLAVYRIEPHEPYDGSVDLKGGTATVDDAPKAAFREALAEVWADPEAKKFTIFVFFSMLAYNTQDLILEPFAGSVFGMTPGQSTQLAGMQHGGVLAGMILVAVAASAIGGRILGSLKMWTVGGCIASGIALIVLAIGGLYAPTFPIKASVFALGFANGAFAVAAIASMMNLAGEGKTKREGMRMGLWGASQAIAFGLGGFLGTVAIDITRAVFENTAVAYGVVFLGEALIFLIAAKLAMSIKQPNAATGAVRTTTPGEGYLAGLG
ncbi:MAG: BCD family MFS transporter [Pseudomonadota bacterium]